MNISELKKAVEHLKYDKYGRDLDKEFINALDTLLSACQLLCEVSDKMEPKKEPRENVLECDKVDLYVNGYNLARSEDILWATKKMMGLEEVIDKQKISCVMCKCLLTGIQKERLATAIRQEMGGGE